MNFHKNNGDFSYEIRLLDQPLSRSIIYSSMINIPWRFVKNYSCRIDSGLNVQIPIVSLIKNHALMFLVQRRKPSKSRVSGVNSYENQELDKFLYIFKYFYIAKANISFGIQRNVFYNYYIIYYYYTYYFQKASFFSLKQMFTLVVSYIKQYF